MTYTIEETDLERQHLLAEVLNPLSLKSLSTILLPANANILDIGCGLGDTTLMLNERFPNSTLTGLDGDASLIEAATEGKTLLHPNLNFVCSDALHLPFNDNSFDFVFTRYCLHHVPHALAALQEMKRVCKPGGIVFVHEPDSNSIQSYPESWAYPKLKESADLLFADALIGRKLTNYFKKINLENIFYDVQAILADQNSALKKFYAMTAPALGKALLQKKLIDKDALHEWVTELERVEHDDEAIILMHPTVAVWGTKIETSDGSGHFTSVVLNPVVTVAADSMIEKANQRTNQLTKFVTSLTPSIFGKP